METKSAEELIDELLEENTLENEENNIEEDTEDVPELTDDELLDLLEENVVEDDFFSDRDDDIIDEFSASDETTLEDFDIDKYLQENFSFKEIESIPFEEYKEKQLQNKDVVTIYRLYEKGYKLKDLETFDDFIKFKQKNVHVYLITIGLPFEYNLFGLEPKLFVCKAFTSADYTDMLKENPEADHDISFFNDFMLSRCILFPEYRIEDIPKLEVGVADVLLPAIMKNSRFDANYQIKRL